MGYNPTLGRFMQRDPIGYADGMNPYQAVGGNPIRYVDPLGLQSQLPTSPPSITQIPADGWGYGDFVDWYFNGQGQPVTLAQIGLAAQFENLVGGEVHDFFAATLEDMIGTGLKLKCGRRLYKHRIDNTVTDVTNSIFSVGNSTFFRSARCFVFKNCSPNGCSVTVSCDFRFKIRDWFANPLDIGMEIQGGTPYRINHDFGFSDSLTIPVPCDKALASGERC